ncbi:MAG TPA: UDP-N-acetylmuramate--L-alanine ligase [Bacteroidia bacterium]|jgi:UDP-N-acetylmuramate--alanine ligase|nr:UDP-N-acetylmuramate--L-alanine ligase [Bacteroidia bacterium]
MKLLDYKLIYFLGIGGIGMSALTRYFNHYGIQVAGYDKTPTVLTSELQNEGVEIHFDENPEYLEHLLAEFKKNEVLIVYTPAVPRDHAEFVFLQKNSYVINKRSEVLGAITKNFKTIAVAGTHGKTTTSSLVAHILKTAGFNTFAFLGGITKNYNTNLLLGGADSEAENTYVVVEADEYDRSFLTLYPYIGVITSVDADHLDIYGDVKFMHDSYTMFAEQVKGELIVKKSVDNTLALKAKRYTYAVNLEADFCANNIEIHDADFYFDVKSSLSSFNHALLGIPGVHNIENATAAIAVAQLLKIENSVIKNALQSFGGVKRRFDYQIKTKEVVYIDDYAHHPEELKAAIGAAKALYPNEKVTGIFQPHLFTRTRDFADGFAESLDMLDECILLDIYPAREKPIPGITSQMLLDKMKSTNKKLVQKNEVIEFLKTHDTKVLMTLGAGDIDTLVEPIEKLLKEKYKK